MHHSYLQRKNQWRAGNLNATNVAKTLTFFFKRENTLNQLKKSPDSVASPENPLGDWKERRFEKRQGSHKACLR